MPPTEPLFTRATVVAKRLGLDRRTFVQACEAGSFALPVVRLGVKRIPHVATRDADKLINDLQAKR